MPFVIARVVLVFLSLAVAGTASAQSAAQSTATSVPRVVRIAGVFAPANGLPPSPVETVTLAIYADETGGAPLWQETQYVTLDDAGRYTVLLGATQPDGLPLDIFASGEGRWLGRRFERAGEPEQARVSLPSVPYALKAADADTLGGRPPSAYALVVPATTSGSGPASLRTAAADTQASGSVAPAAASDGTTNYVAKYLTSTVLGNSALFESGGRVGVNTATPADYLHIRFTDTGGVFTGLAVQNLGGGASSYSGTLFYDQNGALAQFQGFNNSTHEYRINNIATGGSINFMLGGVSKLQIANTGNVTVAGNMTVNGNIGAKYQDVAEWVDTPSPLDAGTVVIVDPTEPNRVLASPKAYDTRVAGAVSAQPGLLLGEPSAGKAMVAQSGRVRVKADATHGAIGIGDLLVTSPTPGFAMVSKPVKIGGQQMHRPGTLLGKALEALPGGKGEILVLLTLQ